MQLTISNKRIQIKPVSFIADFLLTGMVIGPIAAPFLAVSGLPILPTIANIIYFMGLFATRILNITDKGKSFYWLHQYGWNGAALASILMMAYPLEMAAQILGWWSFQNSVVTFFGLITGLAWGLFTMPILHSKQTDN